MTKACACSEQRAAVSKHNQGRRGVCVSLTGLVALLWPNACVVLRHAVLYCAVLCYNTLNDSVSLTHTYVPPPFPGD
jgi:hypothetical protein